MSEIIGFLPLRGGSKGIPKKNIKNFCGKPLFVWVLKEMLETPEINRVYVSTDDADVESLIKSYFFHDWQSRLLIYRQSALSAGDTVMWEQCILELSKSDPSISDEDILVMAQATSPFTQSTHFREGIELYRSKQNKNSSVVTCVPSHRFSWFRYGLSRNYDYNCRPRRQDWDGDLIENGAFCINSVRNVKRYENRLSDRISVYIMPEYAYTEIDSYDDFVIAEYLFNKYVLAKEGYFTLSE